MAGKRKGAYEALTYDIFLWVFTIVADLFFREIHPRSTWRCDALPPATPRRVADMDQRSSGLLTVPFGHQGRDPREALEEAGTLLDRHLANALLKHCRRRRDLAKHANKTIWAS